MRQSTSMPSFSVCNGRVPEGSQQSVRSRGRRNRRLRSQRSHCSIRAASALAIFHRFVASRPLRRLKIARCRAVRRTPSCDKLPSDPIVKTDQHLSRVFPFHEAQPVPRQQGSGLGRRTTREVQHEIGRVVAGVHELAAATGGGTRPPTHVLRVKVVVEASMVKGSRLRNPVSTPPMAPLLYPSVTTA